MPDWLFFGLWGIAGVLIVTFIIQLFSWQQEYIDKCDETGGVVIEVNGYLTCVEEFKEIKLK